MLQILVWLKQSSFKHCLCLTAALQLSVLDEKKSKRSRGDDKATSVSIAALNPDQEANHINRQLGHHPSGIEMNV